MKDFSALMSSRYVTSDGDGTRSFQLESREISSSTKKIRYRSAKGKNQQREVLTQSAYTLHQWHHLVLVKYDNDTVQIYLDNESKTKDLNGNDNNKWSTLKILSLIHI